MWVKLLALNVAKSASIIALKFVLSLQIILLRSRLSPNLQLPLAAGGVPRSNS